MFNKKKHLQDDRLYVFNSEADIIKESLEEYKQKHLNTLKELQQDTLLPQKEFQLAYIAVEDKIHTIDILLDKLKKYKEKIR